MVVVGTATDIGKTWVGGQVLARLRADGATVAARKPAQSFDPAEDHPTDAEVLARRRVKRLTSSVRAHRTYEVAMAPPMAADVLGRSVPTLDDLSASCSWPSPAVDVGWFETVGGPRSPIGADGDAVDAVERLDPDLVVLVADAGLGTVNAVLVSVAPFTGRRCVTLLNRFDPDDDLHRRNLDWRRTREGLEVVVDLEALTKVVRAG